VYQRILVPFDGSLTAAAGLDEALRLARCSGGCVRLIHVIDALAHTTGFESSAAYTSQVLPALRAQGQRILEQGAQRARALGVTVEAWLHEQIPTDVATAVLTQAREWNADLIALGTHGRRGLERFEFGSDAEQIARRANVPVLLVRQPETGRV
jgi:nucleotide-binding universal stress UspA family protein